MLKWDMKQKLLFILLCISVWANYKTTAEVRRLTELVDKEMVFNIDQARYDFATYLNYFYYQGCISGGQHTPDWQIIDEQGWKVHGLHAFCQIKQTEAQEFMNNEINNFAKRSR